MNKFKRAAAVLYYRKKFNRDPDSIGQAMAAYKLFLDQQAKEK